MAGEWGQQGDQGEPGTRGVSGVTVSRHTPCLHALLKKSSPKICHYLLTLKLFQTYDFIGTGMLVTKQLTSIAWEKKSYGSQWLPATVWLKTFFKISYFVFDRRNKLIQV